MASTNPTAVITMPDRDLVFTRVINAPRARVFKAFTDPSQLAKWWGPRGFTNPVSKVDLKPGGAREIVMRAPDGREFPMKGFFREVVEDERLVIIDSVADHSPEWHAAVNAHRPSAEGNIPELLWTLTFEDQKGKTKITIHYHFALAEDRDALVTMGMTEGWSQSLDKLEELLAAK